MVFRVLSLYKEFIDSFAATGVIGRAVDSGAIGIDSIDIRSYSLDKHMRVDDYPYGGGAGMVLSAQPVVDSVRAVRGEREIPAVFFSPRGKTLNSALAKHYSKFPELILLCGHFEGIDERALEILEVEEVSIGDYILTGGHLAACCFIDSVSRYVDGVLGNSESSENESFENGLIEHSQYTRPREFEGLAVPEALLSGSHSLIADWRMENSLEATRKYRPDLYKKHLDSLRNTWRQQK
ncbi:MAG: tRNA (guanosine(37)-N1)-methyltransferase TrmD [Eubacteriaceae bacterium]|nr:tRNA (guanosine(37)-N1)-methyltransferase TrmD [Eubacteriaceae bacterium]